MHTVRFLPVIRNDLNWIVGLAGLAQFDVALSSFGLRFPIDCSKSDAVLAKPHTGLQSTMSSAESNPAGGMQGLLLRLHAALGEEDSRSAARTCHDIVGDLGHECMQVLSENELGKTDKSDSHQTLENSATSLNLTGKLQNVC